MPGRVLIVEDVPTNRLILRSRLMRAYYDVLEAESGLEAIEIARAEAPDIILLDVMMPGIDGFETCRRIKTDPETMHIPVVMLTALDKREDKVLGLQVGADDFLTKPFEDVALMSRVSSLIRIKQMVDELALRGRTAADSGYQTVLKASQALTFEDAEILVVSADDSTREGIVEMLSSELQCRIETSDSVAGGLELAQSRVFDALIIDHALGDDDPLRLGSVVHARPETRQSAIIYIAPGDDIAQAAKALELGFSDYITAPIDLIELTARARSQLRRKRFSDQLRENMRVSMADALTDPLTGTYNRRYAASHLDALIDRCREAGSDLALMMLDLDHFKSINDSRGHAAGDEVLREFAERLRNNVRGMDLVARMGGEEFMVVMPDVQPELAGEIAERVRAAVEAPTFGGGDGGPPIEVTVSIGLALLRPGESVFELVKRADLALYESKGSGRNRVTLDDAA